MHFSSTVGVPVIFSIILQNALVEGGEYSRWHNLGDRLKFKGNAEPRYSPTMKIMVNQLWDRSSLGGGEDKYPILREVDMDLTPKQWRRYSEFGFFFDNQMDIIPDPWPASTVKYRFSGDEAVGNKDVVLMAMKEWSEKTKCIKFVEDSSSAPNKVLHIVKRKQVFASVGFRSDRAKHWLSIPDHALDIKVIMHLLGHVLGLPHAHSRPDRDRFIRFLKHNLELEDVLFLNFRQDCPYDYSSIMHYDHYAFTMASTGEISFEPKCLPWSPHKELNEFLTERTPEVEPRRLFYVIGRWTTPSWTDIFHVENAYGCERAASCYPTKLSVYKAEGVQQFPLPYDLMWGTLKKHVMLIREEKHLNDFTFNVYRVPETFVLDLLMTYTTDRVVDDDACHRMVTFIQPAQKPSREQMAYWLLSGCTWLQIDVYDQRFDLHEVICGADFARNPRKALLTSLNVRAYIRMVKMDDPVAKSMKDGMVSALGYVDFICTGASFTQPPCQGVPDSTKQRGFLFN